MSNYTKNQEAEDDSCSVEFEPLIPEGEYKCSYLEHWTTGSGKSGKLVIHFVIIEGDYQGAVLKAYFNVLVKGTPKKYGKFTAKGRVFRILCQHNSCSFI